MRRPARPPHQTAIRLGQSLYLHATSVGKLFAAHDRLLRRRLFSQDRPRLTERTLVGDEELEREMARILAQDHAISREEAIVGVVGIAVPVRDDHDTVVAAIHISALSNRMTAQEEVELLTAARRASVQIERDLGRVPDDIEVAEVGMR